MKKINLTPSVLQDRNSLQPRSGGPMFSSEVMHRQEGDLKRTREEIGALEDGKMLVRQSYPQSDEKVAQVCWYSVRSPL